MPLIAGRLQTAWTVWAARAPVGGDARRLLALLVLVALGSGTVLGETSADEYRLKAVFLYRFAEFVEWPPEAWANRDQIEICALAKAPFAQALREMIGSERLRGRAVAIREIHADDPIETCHLLFASGGPDLWRPALRRVASLPVLTVGDGDTFLDDGGVIQMRTLDRRVRFEISMSAAQHAGLRLSSQLLRLALEVRGGPS
jgi:hypothetical protein